MLDEIDPEVEVVRGQPRGGATTMAALDDSFDAVFLVGHHAKVGDYPGICAHTISYGEYRDVRLAGQSVSEGEIFATVAAQHGVPTRSSPATTSSRPSSRASVRESRPRS